MKSKSNKEIAHSLDISLGTVKQHAAALFKRMDVRNRSMAISQGMALVGESTSTDTHEQSAQTPLDYCAEDSLLVRRPCTTVSFRASPILDISQKERFNRILVELAGSVDALYIPDDSGGGEVLLGIKTLSEWDVIVAVQIVQQARDQTRSVLETGGPVLSAAINCGLAVISVDAEGRWLGDTVATPVTSVTRKMLNGCALGEVHIGASAIGMLCAFHAGSQETGSVSISLDRIREILKFDFGAMIHQIGRAAQYQTLSHALTTSVHSHFFQLCGQVGAGKTHMCRTLFSQSVELGLPGKYFRSLPGAHFFNARTGVVLSLQDVCDEVATLDKAEHALVIVDDADLLHEDIRAAVIDTLFSGHRTRIVAILTSQVPRQEASQIIELGHLSIPLLEKILASSATRSSNSESALFVAARDAIGIPLYALELSSMKDADTTLPMLTAIACRIHRERLSWLLLRYLVKSGETLDTLDEPAVSRAVAAGILMRAGKNGCPVFAAPILQRAVASLAI